MERRILIIDDDRSMCEVLELELRRRDFDVSSVTSPHEALARFEREDFGLVITDVNMADMSGVELCEQLVRRREDMPVIVITAYANMETAIAAIRAGAYDFVTKPFDMDELALTIERALKHRALREEVKRLRKAVEGTQRFDEILGTSAAMLKMCELITRVADTETTVLITGESGTGKELVAKALPCARAAAATARSSRSTAPRCPSRCSKRAFRSHQRGLHRRAKCPPRSLHQGESRHALSRRDWRNAGGNAGASSSVHFRSEPRDRSAATKSSPSTHE